MNSLVHNASSSPRSAPQQAHSTTKKTRGYNSTLRREHAETTKARILDALDERIRCGDRELSYARLAKQASVSIPTIYRHFPVREDLIRAFVGRLDGATFDQSVTGFEDVYAQVRLFFRRFDDPDDVVAKGRLGVMWEISRVGTVPRRRAGFQTLVDERCAGLPAKDRAMLVDVCTVLVSSAVGEAFRGYLGLNAEQTADRVIFALDALLDRGTALAKQKTKKR